MEALNTECMETFGLGDRGGVIVILFFAGCTTCCTCIREEL